jgi:hypothetical protein
MDVKRKTVGIDWKVPITGLVTVVVWAVAHYAGIDLAPYTEIIIAGAVGLLAGRQGPAPKTEVVREGGA